MSARTENYLENLLKMSLSAENEAAIRNGLHNIIMNSGSGKGGLGDRELKDCYRKLRKLQNFCLCSRRERAEGFCCLNELLDEICGAGDILLDMKGRGVAFLPCEGDLFARCHPSELTAVILNMVSNACVHSETPVIDVSLKKSGNRAVVTVKNSGEMDLERLAKSCRLRDSGAAAMLSFAARYDARVLWCAGEDCEAVISMPVADKDKKIRCCQTPDFSDLLRDKLSPVYVGLCDALDGIVF